MKTIITFLTIAINLVLSSTTNAQTWHEQTSPTTRWLTRCVFINALNVGLPVIQIQLFTQQMEVRAGTIKTTLVNDQLNLGTYEIKWDATNHPSGLYFYKLISENFSETKRMVLIK